MRYISIQHKLSNILYARFQILPVDVHFRLFWSAGIPTMIHECPPIKYLINSSTCKNELEHPIWLLVRNGKKGVWKKQHGWLRQSCLAPNRPISSCVLFEVVVFLLGEVWCLELQCTSAYSQMPQFYQFKECLPF